MTATNGLPLPAGWSLHILPAEGLSLAELRLRALDAQLYALLGHTGQQPSFYAGMSADLEAPRAAASFGQWVHRMRAIEPQAVLLLSHPTLHTPAALRFTECQMIRQLALRRVSTNTQTSCDGRIMRTTRSQRMAGIDATHALVSHLEQHLPVPAPTRPLLHRNNRDSYVSIVLAADRGVDAADVRQRALAAGVPLTGQTTDFTVRRDLHEREGRYGIPRIYDCRVGQVRVFYGPHLSKRAAIESYSLAQRRRLRAGAAA
jgi:hypothetical protein